MTSLPPGRERNFTTSLGDLIQCFNCLNNKDFFFLYSERIFPEAACAYCLLPCRHLSLRRGNLYLLYNWILGIGRVLLDPPKLPLCWTNPIPSTFFICRLCTQDHDLMISISGWLVNYHQVYRVILFTFMNCENTLVLFQTPTISPLFKNEYHWTTQYLSLRWFLWFLKMYACILYIYI